MTIRYLIATTFLVCGAFLLIAARQVARDTNRNPSLLGQMPAGGARILGAGFLILAVIWLVY